MSVLDLARPQIRAFQPYSSARMEARGGNVLLNANESPWAAFGDEGNSCNRYPDPQPIALLTRLAALYDVDVANLLVGRGSDEAIDLLIRAFCVPGRDAIAIHPPTFGMYAVCARVQDAAIIEMPLDSDFGIDADALIATITADVKLVFLCSPNNPTGGLLPIETIQRIATALAGKALVVVDEAYIEFADSPSAATLLPEHDNIAVLRTLSKAWALAGARIGSLIANRDVIDLLRRIMPPYPLPTPCVDAALVALSSPGIAETRHRIGILLGERERVASVLRGMPGIVAVLPSRANFVTVRCHDASRLYQRLLEAGIVVRDVSKYPLLAGCLRFSVGSPIENDRLLETIRSKGED